MSCPKLKPFLIFVDRNSGTREFWIKILIWSKFHWRVEDSLRDPGIREIEILLRNRYGVLKRKISIISFHEGLFLESSPKWDVVNPSRGWQLERICIINKMLNVSLDLTVTRASLTVMYSRIESFLLEMDAVSKMAAYWNIPIIGYMASSTAFADKTIYKTQARVSLRTTNSLALAVNSILKHYSWNRVAIITNTGTLAFERTAAFEEIFHNRGIKVVKKIMFDEYADVKSIVASGYLTEMKNSARSKLFPLRPKYFSCEGQQNISPWVFVDYN